MLDELYDAIRKATDREQIKRLSTGKELAAPWARWLAGAFFKKETDQAVNLAVKIKEHTLDPLMASSAINAFQWCKARLTLEHPEAVATVQRFEADSKFFRSLLVVERVLIPWGVVNSRPAVTLFSAPVLALAIWRFLDQRLKATNQAYWYIITLEGQRQGGFRQSPQVQSYGMSHAGGVVFRRRGNQLEYVLVRAKNNPQEWVLPKGHIEPGELLEETAVREVHEETGVWATIKGELDSIAYAATGENVRVQYYMMESVEAGKPSDKREHRWLPLDEALRKTCYEETRHLLELANQKLAKS